MLLKWLDLGPLPHKEKMAIVPDFTRQSTDTGKKRNSWLVLLPFQWMLRYETTGLGYIFVWCSSSNSFWRQFCFLESNMTLNTCQSGHQPPLWHVLSKTQTFIRYLNSCSEGKHIAGKDIRLKLSFLFSHHCVLMHKPVFGCRDNQARVASSSTWWACWLSGSLRQCGLCSYPPERQKRNGWKGAATETFRLSMHLKKH